MTDSRRPWSRRTLLGALLPTGLAVGSDSAAAAAEWNQWRGPGRDGRIPAALLPAAWPARLTRRWKVEVGEGHSSPVCAGERVFQHSRERDEEVIRALDVRTGRVLWSDRYPAPYEMDPAARGHGKGPKSTPAFGSGRLATLGISGILTVYDAARGRRLWQKSYGREFRRTSPLYGTASSLLIHGSRLIAAVGGHDQGALLAVELESGNELWRWSGDGPAYASPILVTRERSVQIVTQTQRQCVGVAVENGRLLWSLPFTTPYDQNSVTPVAAGERIVFGGVQQPTFAVRLRRNGAAWEAVRDWENRDTPCYMSSPVLVGDRLVGMTDRARGQLFLLDPATGRRLWADEGSRGENVSLLAGSGQVLALDTAGALSVYRLEPTRLVRVARYEVAETPVWAHPALVGSGIVVKDRNSVALWGWG